VSTHLYHDAVRVVVIRTTTAPKNVVHVVAAGFQLSRGGVPPQRLEAAGLVVLDVAILLVDVIWALVA
jgi:hypothetical protein